MAFCIAARPWSSFSGAMAGGDCSSSTRCFSKSTTSLSALAVAGADLIAVGARHNVDARLQAAVFAEGGGHGRLEIDRASARFFGQTSQRGIAQETFRDDLIVIAREREIEAEQHIEVIDFNGT